MTDNTTRSQSTFFSARFGRGRLGERCYNLKLLYMQALDDLDLTFLACVAGGIVFARVVFRRLSRGLAARSERRRREKIPPAG